MVKKFKNKNKFLRWLTWFICLFLWVKLLHLYRNVRITYTHTYMCIYIHQSAIFKIMNSSFCVFLWQMLRNFPSFSLLSGEHGFARTAHCNDWKTPKSATSTPWRCCSPVHCWEPPPGFCLS